MKLTAHRLTALALLGLLISAISVQADDTRSRLERELEKHAVAVNETMTKHAAFKRALTGDTEQDAATLEALTRLTQRLERQSQTLAETTELLKLWSTLETMSDTDRTPSAAQPESSITQLQNEISALEKELAACSEEDTSLAAK